MRDKEPGSSWITARQSNGEIYRSERKVTEGEGKLEGICRNVRRIGKRREETGEMKRRVGEKIRVMARYSVVEKVS